MKIRILFLTLCMPVIAYSQSINQNYIKETIFLNDKGATMSKVDYYNGIGNLVESVGIGANGNNIYNFKMYDSKGREELFYNAIPINSDFGFKNKEELKIASKDFYNDEFAYTKKSYDDADRLTIEEIPGREWHNNNHNNTSKYEFNSDEDRVKQYLVPIDIKKAESYYPAGTLTKKREIDADGREVIIFTDLADNIVLERRGKCDTYYVYNKLGQLTYVLSPKYQMTKDLAGLAYQYEYDNYNNVIKKVLPGAQYTQYWYDKENKLSILQDANLRDKGLYRFYLYDSFKRIVIVGICTNCNLNIQNKKISVDNSSSGFMGTGYDFHNSSLSVVDPTIEQVFYYDDYRFIENSNLKGFEELRPLHTKFSNNLLTGTISRASNGEYEYTVNSYDVKGNLIHSAKKGLKGYITNIENTYTLTNHIKNSNIKVGVKHGSELNIRLSNTYSEQNNLLLNRQIDLNYGSIPNNIKLEYCYDEINRLKSIVRPDKVGRITYDYDLHNWIKKIETNSFKEYLYYADGTSRPCFNGNISSMRWENKNYQPIRAYNFYYDEQNRLKEARYGENGDFSEDKNFYGEMQSYDANGNIVTLERKGLKCNGKYGCLDNLTIGRSGNQTSIVLRLVTDFLDGKLVDFLNRGKRRDSYKYNSFGALISDYDRNITMIDYDDYMNPKRIQFANGNVIKYIYSARGIKLRTIYYTALPNIRVATGETHKLLPSEILSTDSIDYLLNGTLLLENGRIDKYLFPEGYVKAYYNNIAERLRDELVPAKETIIVDKDLNADTHSLLDDIDSFEPYFYNQDHLGNNREVVNKLGRIIQVTNYYPFGSSFCDSLSCLNASLQPYKYNGKEFDRMHGLNTYDYGARQYSPALPSWDRIDPLAEKYYSVSPYAYGGNNPVNRVDFYGMFPTKYAALDYAKAQNVDFRNVRYANDRREWYVSFGEDGKGYESGGTLERRFSERLVDTKEWSTIGNFNSGLGTGASLIDFNFGKALKRSLAYVFYDKTGRYLSSIKPSVKFNNISYEFNPKVISRIAKTANRVSIASGFISAYMTLKEIRAKKKNFIGEGGLDLIMTGAGYIPPYGWVVSGAYFLGKYGLEEFDMDFWNK
ncbi:RHS repeat-associated core domain-containing protein [Prevotella pallens]|uniref:RHS repeat-associated core domain-containing protein n=2 Tax=Prevotella pallens TaxID=60133 RepID=UPI0028EEF8B9|nr:RHS repeat-associated core domain-containing protein [Prevotella pallens]